MSENPTEVLEKKNAWDTPREYILAMHDEIFRRHHPRA